MFGGYGGSGIMGIPLAVIADYHPAFALAIINGVEVHPNSRTLQVTFNSSGVGLTPLPASFDEPIGVYSIFSGADHTIDPTGAFAGNVLKTMSDTAQAMTSGVTVTLLARTPGGGDYAPIPNDTPLQLVSRVLSKAAGIWAMRGPQSNIKAGFTLIATPPATPFTVWLTLEFLVLGDGGDAYLCIPPAEARAELLKHPFFSASGCGWRGAAHAGPAAV